MSGSVPFVRAAVLTHRLLLRQLVTRGRIIALLVLGGVLVLAAVVGVVAFGGGPVIDTRGVRQRKSNPPSGRLVLRPAPVCRAVGNMLPTGLRMFQPLVRSVRQ